MLPLAGHHPDRLYEHNHDVRGNKPPEGGFQKFVSEGHEENTIAVSLQEGGYRTALFGKYLNSYPGDDPTYVPPGWDEWYGKERGQKLYDYKINENGEVVSYGSDTEDFFTDVLTGQSTDFVRRAAPEEQPFFAYVAPTAPHGPATPAERHKGAFAGEEAPRPPLLRRGGCLRQTLHEHQQQQSRALFGRRGFQHRR